MLIPFEFDGVNSSVYALYLANFGGPGDGTKTTGDAMEVKTVKSPKESRWLQTAGSYDTPLTFTFQVVKYTCSDGAAVIEPREFARILRWLVRKEYHYLRFEKSGWDNVFYNCTLKVQKYEIGGVLYGLEIEATCDAPWGYSEPKENRFHLDEKSHYDLYNYSDEDGGIFPELVQIRIPVPQEDESAAGIYDLTLTNTFSGGKGDTGAKIIQTQIKNCQPGEILSLDWHRNICSSEHTHHTLPDDFNYIFPELFSDISCPKNTFTADHPCDVVIRHREIRKGVPV